MKVHDRGRFATVVTIPRTHVYSFDSVSNPEPPSGGQRRLPSVSREPRTRCTQHRPWAACAVGPRPVFGGAQRPGGSGPRPATLPALRPRGPARRRTEGWDAAAGGTGAVAGRFSRTRRRAPTLAPRHSASVPRPRGSLAPASAPSAGRAVFQRIFKRPAPAC